MIIELKDLLPKLYAKYPDLTEASIERICRVGLRGINRVLRDGDELFITGHGSSEEYKFFVPLTPEDHDRFIKHRYFIHKFRKERKDAKLKLKQTGNS